MHEHWGWKILGHIEGHRKPEGIREDTAIMAVRHISIPTATIRLMNIIRPSAQSHLSLSSSHRILLLTLRQASAPIYVSDTQPANPNPAPDLISRSWQGSEICGNGPFCAGGESTTLHRRKCIRIVVRIYWRIDLPFAQHA
jgi:hypothetical protein